MTLTYLQDKYYGIYMNLKEKNPHLLQKYFKSQAKYRSDKELIAVARKFKFRSELEKKDGGAYTAIRNRGLEKIAYKHMKRLIVLKYTDKEIEKNANKYESSGDWARYDSSLYMSAIHRGKKFFKKVTKHMLKNSRGKAVKCVTTKEVFKSMRLAAKKKKLNYAKLGYCLKYNIPYNGKSWQYLN